jgi:hypothetical protein
VLAWSKFRFRDQCLGGKIFLGGEESSLAGMGGLDMELLLCYAMLCYPPLLKVLRGTPLDFGRRLGDYGVSVVSQKL